MIEVQDMQSVKVDGIQAGAVAAVLQNYPTRGEELHAALIAWEQRLHQSYAQAVEAATQVEKS